jgi:hypothetical protein
MFGILTRSARTPGFTPRRARLGVEQLETRDCPSALTFMNFGVSVLNIGKQVELRGTISDTNPTSVQVNFTGVAIGSVYADANGFFDVKTNASGLGTVNASAIDNSGNVAGASGQVTDMAPSMTLNFTNGPNKQVTLSGKVTDAQPGGMTVTFSGVATGSVVTNADGTFSKTLTATALGTIYATTQDVWGLSSAAAQVTVTNSAPSITLFANNVSGNLWTFSGKVMDEYAPGLTVTFSGTPSVDGKTVIVQSDGTFSLTVTLQPGETGWIYATTTDWWGVQSNIAAFSLPNRQGSLI